MNISQFKSQYASDEDFLKCWRLQSCGSCLSSDDNCGWCPYSSLCVPLPKNGHLLSPIWYDDICPFPWQERWELRTSTFGCNCSTTTFLAALITCLSTLLSLLLLWVIVKLCILIFKMVRGARTGWVVEEGEEGRREYSWVRTSWKDWWKSKRQEPEDEPLLG